MAFLVLDIETIPRPIIDEMVEDAVAKKVQGHIERTGDDPQNTESLIRSLSPFFGQLLCIGMHWLQEDGSSKDKVVCEENEDSTLQTFFNIINHPGSTLHVSFTITGWDLIFPS